MCVKDWTDAATLPHPERSTAPLVRHDDGILREASWDEAMDHMAHAIYREPRKANRIRLLSLAAPRMRMFNITRFAFFLCFFVWFGIAPLMAVVLADLLLTKAQIGNTIIASVAITIVGRLAFAPPCDRRAPVGLQRTAGERTVFPEMCGAHNFSVLSQSNVRASVGPTLA